jgi:TonB-dependent receptor
MQPSQRTRLGSVFLLLVALVALSGAVLAQGSGTVTGQVLDSVGNPVIGVEVAVAGTNLRTATGGRGAYRMVAVPAGTQSLVFTYLGYEPLTFEVEVAEGQTVTQDAILESFVEAIVVTANPLLVGQAAALNRQKNNTNITNVVAADQIERFPDTNTAEATQRIPAITLLRDQGEGRYVLVRGTEARLNSTTVNGERIPSPEAGIRDIALDVIPADLLQAIEVSKALTPDMDGDAIGGTVDLITKRAPEQRRFGANLAGGQNELTEDSITNADFVIGGRVNDGRTGLLLSGSSYITDRGSDNFEPEYDDGFLKELQLRDYTIKRERSGATFSLDHGASDSAEYFVRGLWNNYRDTEIRRAKTENPDDGEIVREIKDRLQESDITSITAGGLYQTGTNSLSYRVAWNYAKEETPDQVTSEFLQEDVEFDPNVGPGSIDPNNIRANPQNEDINEFVFDKLETEFKSAEEEDVVAAVDFTKGFYQDSGLSGLWKAGAKARFKDKSQDVTVFEFESDDDLLLTGFASNWASETPFLGGRYDIGPFFDPVAMRELLASGALEEERVLDEDLGDFTSTEDTLAAYGMTEIAFGPKTTFLGGVRVESTDTDYQAFELAFDEEGDPTALTPVRGSRSYTEWLPMLHLKRQLDDKSNLRAAITRTLARPNFEDLAPFQLTNFEDEEIVRGNPDLEVTTSLNLDLLYERYLEPLGIFSAGVFYKDMDDNIFFSVFDEDVAGTTFEVEQPVNGTGAELQGFEVAYQNRFASLPAPWDGLGLYFNFTYSDSEAEYPDRPNSKMQGQAADVGNLALTYEKGGFTGRLSWNYNSEYILLVGGEPAEDQWLDEHLQIDFLARMRINEKMSVFLELVNLGDEPYRVYEGTVDRPRQEEYYSWWGTIGFRFSL